MVTPDEEPEKSDCDRAVGDHSIPENPLVAVNAHQFADDTHRRKDHDVHSRVGVEPEEVLERDRVPVELRIENPDAQKSFRRKQQHGDPQNRCREDLDDGGRVNSPQEQWHSEPSHPGWTHGVDRHDKVQAGEDRTKA